MTSWTARLIGQLEFYWGAHLWPRLAGLTDQEYFWEPADGCRNLRRHGDRWVLQGADQDTPHGPLTTIAWRMTHMSVEVLESRFRAFFGGEGPHQWAPGERLLAAGDLPGTAAEAVAYLEGRTPAGGTRSPA